MTTPPQTPFDPSLFNQPPPTGPPVWTEPAEGEVVEVAKRVRPWWGLGDVVLGVPFIVVFLVIGTFLAVPFTDLDGMFNGDQVETPVALLVTSLLAQQFAQAAWPFVVSKWKGLGPVADWRLKFQPVDLAIGFGTAFIALGLATAAAAVTSELVGLTDESQADNTQFLRDAEGTPWIYFVLFAVVVGAPVAEELFFRGLILRAFEKRAGSVVAVIGSTLLFTLPHFTGSDLDGTLVLFASIAMVGLVFAVITLSVDRLAPAIIAHMLFNTVGAAGALGAFDNLAT